MPQTLEKRVDELEKSVAQLAAILNGGARKKDWLATVGTLADDETSREADRLGCQYRQSLADSKDSAGT